MNTPNNFKVTKVSEDGVVTIKTSDFAEKIKSLGDDHHAMIFEVFDVLPAIQNLLTPLPEEVFFSAIATIIDVYLADNKIPNEVGDEMLKGILAIRGELNEAFPLN